MGLVQKESLVVFYIRVPWETERQRGQTRRELRAKVKSKHPLLYRREKDRLT